MQDLPEQSVQNQMGILIPQQCFIPPSQIVAIMATEPLDILARIQYTDSYLFKLKQSTQFSQDSDYFRNPYKCFPCPAMTELVHDIGSYLVLEKVFGNIMSSKNEHSWKQVGKLESELLNLRNFLESLCLKNSIDASIAEIALTYATKSSTSPDIYSIDHIIVQINTLLNSLEQLYAPIKTKNHLKCAANKCSFIADTVHTLFAHTISPHKIGNKLTCPYCGFDTSHRIDYWKHQISVHRVPCDFAASIGKYSCPLCPYNSVFKGEMDSHLISCKHTFRLRKNLAPIEEDLLHINRLFWNLTHAELAVIQQRMMGPRKSTVFATDFMPRQLLPPNRLVKSAHDNVTTVKKIPSDKALQEWPASRQFAIFEGQASWDAIDDLNTIIASGLMNKEEHIDACYEISTPVTDLHHNKIVHNINTSFTKSQFLESQEWKSSLQLDCNTSSINCEICDEICFGLSLMLEHFKVIHGKMLGKELKDLNATPPLSCSRCLSRFYAYEGLERHLLTSHGLVSKNLLSLAQQKRDAGKCAICGKVYAFHFLHHVAVVHNIQLCSASIVYSCDVCRATYTCHILLEEHLAKHLVSLKISSASLLESSNMPMLATNLAPNNYATSNPSIGNDTMNVKESATLSNKHNFASRSSNVDKKRDVKKHNLSELANRLMAKKISM